MKYKNKDGIELSFNGNDLQSALTREVITEAIRILSSYNRFDARSAEWALHRGKIFLEENFDIEQGRSDEWRIQQFNRNRGPEEWVKTIEEMETRIQEMEKK